MNKDVIEVQVRAVLPLEGSFAVFLGNETKVFVIYIDESVGTAISMFMRGVSKERPLTHDLVGHLLLAFGARVERVVINNINGSVFHARLIISAENELQTTRKVIELDARPSDSIAMAVQQSAPIFVAKSVWDTVEDVSDTLAQIEKKGLEVQQAAEAAAEEEGMKTMTTSRNSAMKTSTPLPASNRARAMKNMTTASAVMTMTRKARSGRRRMGESANYRCINAARSCSASP